MSYIVVQNGRAALLVSGGSVTNGAWEISFAKEERVCWASLHPERKFTYEKLIQAPKGADYNEILNKAQDLLDRGQEIQID